MAALFPFRPLRATADAARQVAAVPYDVVSRDEARELAARNPLSFLHVSRPEIDMPDAADPSSDAAYTAAAVRFRELIRDAPLVREELASLYIYRLRRGTHEQFGIAGCYALDDYEADVIKKHERTRRDKEDDRTRHMLALRAQTGPVLLTYRRSREIDALVSAAAATGPVIDFEAEDGVGHTIWRLGPQASQALVAAVARVPSLYIADGHHRAASAERARKMLRQMKGAGTISNESGGSVSSRGVAVAEGVLACDVFLAVAFADSQMRILSYNRLVRDLNGLTPEACLAAVGERFDVAPGSAMPSRKGDIAMYLAGRWYQLRAKSWHGADAISSLDVSVLQQTLLDPVLAIRDVRTDPRIEFVGGVRGTAALEKAVNDGAAAVAFSLYPVEISELMAVADAGLIMPPKSTWFEPKLRDGLLIHEI